MHAQVLMVVFDQMASAQRMAAWLEGALDAHMLAASKLRAAKRACHRRISEAHMPLKHVHSDDVAAGIAPLLEQATSPLPAQLDPGSGAVVGHAGLLACCMLHDQERMQDQKVPAERSPGMLPWPGCHPCACRWRRRGRASRCYRQPGKLAIQGLAGAADGAVAGQGRRAAAGRPRGRGASIGGRAHSGAAQEGRAGGAAGASCFAPSTLRACTGSHRAGFVRS